ncbi:MAG: hypothetical protein LUH47_01285 [Clostridiales bacterium]|nr:hypothetical protein [Clostridiales bacterium]
MMNKKLAYVSIIIVSVFAAFLLSGCYDNFDLEDRSLCTAMAVDYAEDEGYTVIISVPVLEDEEEIGRSLKEETAGTLAEAIELIDGKQTKQLYFGHMQTVITGMGLLRSEKALKELTAYLSDNVQIDKNILLVGAYEIREIMNSEPKEDKLTGFFISGYYDSRKNEKTFVNKETLLAYLKDNSEDKTAVIPVLSIENDEPAFSSAAVLKNNSLAAILNRREAQGFMWLTGKGSNGTLICDNPAITADIIERETDCSFYEEDGVLKLDITINAVGNMWNYTDDEIAANGSEYLEAFKKEIYSQTEAALLSLEKTDCDALSLNSLLKQENKELYKKYGSAAEAKTKVTVNLSLNFV